MGPNLLKYGLEVINGVLRWVCSIHMVYFSGIRRKKILASLQEKISSASWHCRELIANCCLRSLDVLLKKSNPIKIQ